MLSVGFGADQLASAYGQSVREDAGGTRHRRPNHLDDLLHPLGVEGLTFLHQ
jgi:hypothetical protein